MDTNHQIAIVIPVHNRIRLTRNCLTALSKQTVQDFMIIVIDDGSSDGTSEMIRNEFPEVKLIQGDGSLWWSAATNIGIQEALHLRCQWIMTLNDDTVASPDFIEKMLYWAKQNPNVLLGALALDIETNMPIYGGERIRWLTAGYTKILSTLPEEQQCGLHEVTHFPGRGLLIPSLVFQKIGLFAADIFPQSAADEDFTMKAIRSGFHVYCNYDARLFTYPKESGDSELRGHRSIHNYWRHLFHIKGGGNLKVFIRFAIRNAPLKYVIPFLFFGITRRVFGYLFEWISESNTKNKYFNKHASDETIHGFSPIHTDCHPLKPNKRYTHGHAHELFIQKELFSQSEEVLFHVHTWPWGKSAPFCLNFDDLSPFRFMKYDFGAEPNKGVNMIQQKLLEETPVKITHFVVPQMNWWIPLRYVDHLANFRTDAFALNNPKNSYWVGWIKELIESKKVEVAWHGFTHFNSNLFRKKFIEFQNTSYAENKILLQKAHDIFEQVGINVKGFRPPGWGFKEDENLFDALGDLHFVDYIAASSFDAGLNRETTTISNWKLQLYKGFVNVPQNIEISKISESTKDTIENALIHNYVITPKGHYCNVPWIPNSITPYHIQHLFELLKYSKEKALWFTTFYEIVGYSKNIQTIKKTCVAEGDKTTYVFHCQKSCEGLTISIKFPLYTEENIFTVPDTFEYRREFRCNCKIIFSENVSEYRITIPRDVTLA